MEGIPNRIEINPSEEKIDAQGGVNFLFEQYPALTQTGTKMTD
jgi:hypothetical protein